MARVGVAWPQLSDAVRADPVAPPACRFRLLPATAGTLGATLLRAGCARNSDANLSSRRGTWLGKVCRGCSQLMWKNILNSVFGLHIASPSFTYNLSASIWTRETTSSAKSNKRWSRLQSGKAIAKQVLHLSFVQSLVAAGLKLNLKEATWYVHVTGYTEAEQLPHTTSLAAHCIWSIPAHSPWNHPPIYIYIYTLVSVSMA